MDTNKEHNENVDQFLKENFGKKDGFSTPPLYFDRLNESIQDRIHQKNTKPSPLRILIPALSGIAAVVVTLFLFFQPNTTTDIEFLSDDQSIEAYESYLAEYSDITDYIDEIDTEAIDVETTTLDEEDVIQYLEDSDLDIVDYYEEI